MRRLLRRFGCDERGAVLVITAAAMIGMIGMAAFAIDVGSWYQVERQVQSSADAAALAGAQDLPASQSTATTDANAYVTKSLLGSPAPTVTVTFPTSTEIKVVVTTTARTFFGKLFGISSANVSATSVASETAPATTCPTAGNTCYAVFAMDTSCTGTTPVVFGGGTTITGGVASNGSLNVGGGGSTFGPTTYGNGSGCTVGPSGYQSQTNSFTSGPTAQAAVVTWPLNYATDFPACAGAACTGPGGTPSFCTQAFTAAVTLVSYYPYTLTSGNIYCDVGTGTASTPTTWNGAITADQSGATIESSFVAGSLTLGGGDTITACGYTASGYAVSGCSSAVPVPTTGNYPVAYAVGTGTAITNASGGGT
jgi:Flp pilus assembly protein TadG